MAHLHHADLQPSKVDMVAAWAPSQPWFEGDADAGFEKVAAFRFDDPEGRVGIETLLVTAGGGPVLQVPLTYRDAPLEGGETWLLGTMEHSVLGTRYVYDGAGDPAYLRAIAAAALVGGSQADEYFEVDGVREFREASAVTTGSGSAGSGRVTEPRPRSVATRDVGSLTVATAGILRVAVARLPGTAAPADALSTALGPSAEREVVSGSWSGHDEPVTFAAVARG